ncbi:hypothetical protein [Shinella zoogloeoides]
MTRTFHASFLLALSSMPAIAADIDAPIIGGMRNGAYMEPVVYSENSSGVSGYVEGSFNKLTDTPYDVDGETWALRGSVNFDAGAGLNLQIDGGYGRTSIEDVGVDQLAGAVHAYHRDDTYAVGAFFQAAALDAGYLDYFGDDTVADYLGGLEAAWSGDDGTLYGRAGYGQARWTDYSADHYMGALGARYYATDNIRFDVEGALHRFSYENADLDMRSVTLSANYRPEAMPVTFFAGYRYDQLDASAAGLSVAEANSSTLFTGLRFSFGSNSLREEERSGPVWTASTLLP